MPSHSAARHCWILLNVCLIAAGLGGRCALGAAPERPEPNWTQVRDDAVQVLSELVKIDTSNPPGQ